MCKIGDREHFYNKGYHDGFLEGRAEALRILMEYHLQISEPFPFPIDVPRPIKTGIDLGDYKRYTHLGEPATQTIQPVQATKELYEAIRDSEPKETVVDYYQRLFGENCMKMLDEKRGGSDE